MVAVWIHNLFSAWQPAQHCLTRKKRDRRTRGSNPRVVFQLIQKLKIMSSTWNYGLFGWDGLLPSTPALEIEKALLATKRMAAAAAGSRCGARKGRRWSASGGFPWVTRFWRRKSMKERKKFGSVPDACQVFAMNTEREEMMDYVQCLVCYALVSRCPDEMYLGISFFW